MSNIGNLDLERGKGVIILKMRHMIAGHLGCYLADAEVPGLIQKLQEMTSEGRTSVRPSALAGASGAIPEERPTDEIFDYPPYIEGPQPTAENNDDWDLI